MAPPYRDARHLFSALTEMAEEFRLALIPMSEAERAELVTRIVAGSEMVFGVWPDAEAEEGVGIAVIRGEDLMPPIVGFETDHEISVAAIPCASREVATAAREVLHIEAPQDPTEEAMSARAALSISEVARLGWAKAGAARTAAPAS